VRGIHLDKNRWGEGKEDDTSIKTAKGKEDDTSIKTAKGKRGRHLFKNSWGGERG
jgi:hypothetical protein